MIAKKYCILVIIIFLTLCLFSCGCGIRQKQIIGVVLPITNGHYVHGRAVGDWMPTEEQLRKAQPIILDYIKQSDERIFHRLNKYRCQYFGIRVNCHKRIYCNFFWLTVDTKKYWQTKQVFVLGGGSRYFQLEYDIETEKCLNFLINMPY